MDDFSQNKLRLAEFVKDVDNLDIIGLKNSKDSTSLLVVKTKNNECMLLNADTYSILGAPMPLADYEKLFSWMFVSP